MIGCKSTPLLSCLKQLIPIANTHDGALPVSLWPPWVTPLLRGEEVCVCVYWGHGAGFTGLWLVECNADEDFIQSAVFMMGEQREWPLLSPDLSTLQRNLFSSLLFFFSLGSLSGYNPLIQLVHLYAHGVHTNLPGANLNKCSNCVIRISVSTVLVSADDLAAVWEAVSPRWG